MLSKLLGRDFPSLLKKADAHAEAGRWGDAKLAYEKALGAKGADDPGRAAAERGLARARAELAAKNLEEAELDLEAGEPEHALDRLRTALALTDDPAKAEALKDRVAALRRSLRDPARPPSLDEEEEDDDLPTGEELVDGVLAPGEADDEAFGGSLMERYELALLGMPDDLAERYLDLGEDFAEAYLDAVEERFEDAERRFARLERKHGGLALYHLERGKTLAALGRIERAEASLRRAAELDRRLEEPVHALARVLLAERKPAEARGVLEEARSHGLAGIDAALLLAECDLAEGNLDAAEGRLKEAARGNAEDWRVDDGLGRVAEARGDWEDAWKRYRRAAARQPKNADLKLRLANAIARHPNEFMKALDLFKQLLKEDAGEKWFLYAQIGRIYQRKGWREQAEEMFEQALVLLPEGDAANRETLEKALAEARGAA